MIYDGTSAHDNGKSSTDRYISKSLFNSTSIYGNTGVGYMYGDVYTENATTSTTRTLQSYYYYYASDYIFDTETGYYTLSDDAFQEIWSSDLEGTYTCRSTSASGTCTSLWKVDTYTNNYQGTYYIYSSTSETDENDVTTYSVSISESTSTGTFASRYYYGKDYTYSATTGYTLVDYDYDVYNGDTNSLTDYYTCGSTSYTRCTTLYHIESASTSVVANVTRYTASYSTYATTHSNKNNSTIKGVVDDWYATNIYNKTDGTYSYDDYISDTLFCNDRSLYSGTGTGTTTTYYGAYNRLNANKYPILTCPNKTNDAFTVDDEVNGNGALTYKVGLITADEVAMAGGVNGISNSSCYLYSGSKYWTMSPFFTYLGLQSWYTCSGTLGAEGGIYHSDSYIAQYTAVRPVINLSSSVILTSGDGTKDSPYTVSLQ